MGRHADPDQPSTSALLLRLGDATNPIGLPAQPAPVADAGDDAAGTPGRGRREVEPKVRAASIAALLSQLVLFYAHRYVPGVEEMPPALLLGVDSLVTGLVAFVAGFCARTLARVEGEEKPARRRRLP